MFECIAYFPDVIKRSVIMLDPVNITLKCDVLSLKVCSVCTKSTRMVLFMLVVKYTAAEPAHGETRYRGGTIYMYKAKLSLARRDTSRVSLAEVNYLAASRHSSVQQGWLVNVTVVHCRLLGHVAESSTSAPSCPGCENFLLKRELPGPWSTRTPSGR